MFRTKEINDFYKSNIVAPIYKNLHKNQFLEAKYELTQIELKANRLNSQSEMVMNDIYLLKQLLSFHNSLITMWEKIYTEKYSSSWNYLQNCLDALRQIKKFGLTTENNDIFGFFENQLLSIEKLYPYRIFASMAYELGIYKCSICGNNIDSLECEHERNELYNGQIAYAIADIKGINHISMVKNPRDKRCAPQYDDNSRDFVKLQYLNKQLKLNTITPITLRSTNETQQKKQNEGYKDIARNEKCPCGSNKKFKKCCIEKMHTLESHVEFNIAPHPYNLFPPC